MKFPQVHPGYSRLFPAIPAYFSLSPFKKPIMTFNPTASDTRTRINPAFPAHDGMYRFLDCLREILRWGLLLQGEKRVNSRFGGSIMKLWLCLKCPTEWANGKRSPCKMHGATGQFNLLAYSYLLLCRVGGWRKRLRAFEVW